MTNEHGLNGLVVKHHDTLQHLVTFTLEERRLFDFCVQYYDSRKGPEDNTRKLHLPVAEFKKAYPQFKGHHNTKFFELLVDTALGIQKKPYKPHKKRAIFWFTELELVDEDTDNPIFKISLTKGIMPFFLGLIDHYISYHRAETIQFNKPLSYTLFEYIQEIFQNGQTPKWRVDLDVLKDRLGAANKYKQFSAFDKYYLKRPLSEINEHTRLKVEYDKLKKGRNIAGIQFRVIQKALDSAVIDTEDLGKIFARELALAEISKTIADKFVQAATDRNLTSAMLEKLPKIKKSWGKNGGKPYSAYLSGVLNKELLEMDLFETSKKEKEKKAMDAIQEELKKQQEEDMKYRKRQMQRDALNQLEQDHPEKYQQLYDQAARDLGIDIDRLKRGDKLKIIFKMIQGQAIAEWFVQKEQDNYM